MAVFSDSDVAEYHEAFQQELKNLANIREQIEEPTGENVIYLRDLKANVESITLVCLKELFNIATPSTFEIRAREVLSHLIDVDNTSSPDLIYRKVSEIRGKKFIARLGFFTLSSAQIFSSMKGLLVTLL